MEERGGRKCKPGYCGVGVWYSKHGQKVRSWPRPRPESSGLRTKTQVQIWNSAPLLHLSVRGFRRAGSPGSCCSRWRSSPAAWRPTARCWSPLRRCRPGWDPQWPVASVGCPRSEPDGRRLRKGDNQRDVSDWRSREWRKFTLRIKFHSDFWGCFRQKLAIETETLIINQKLVFVRTLTTEGLFRVLAIKDSLKILSNLGPNSNVTIATIPNYTPTNRNATLIDAEDTTEPV